jgi:hypothetical protein
MDLLAPFPALSSAESSNRAVQQPFRPRLIVSGGQTGADRAGLDFSLGAGIPHGGWCPRGRTAEDGPIPLRYLLREHASSSYPARTKANVRDATLTLVFSARPLTKGSRLTVDCCGKERKPCIVLQNFPNAAADAVELRRKLPAFNGVLNVAGTRESSCPGMYAHVFQVLRLVTSQA